MDTEWITTRKITCLNSADERVTVFRQRRLTPRDRSVRHRYVLGNTAPVVVWRDSHFCILTTNDELRPMNIEPPCATPRSGDTRRGR